MTDILFKGKEKYCNDNVWVVGSGFNRQYDSYGNLHMYIGVDVYSEKEPKQINVEWIEIIPETLSRFTGLTDIHDEKIFENDIIKSCEYDDVYLVKYFAEDNYPAFDVVPEINVECNGLSHLHIAEGIEIIGNYFDNPELLGGVE